MKNGLKQKTVKFCMLSSQLFQKAWLASYGYAFIRNVQFALKKMLLWDFNIAPPNREVDLTTNRQVNKVVAKGVILSQRDIAFPVLEVGHTTLQLFLTEMAMKKWTGKRKEILNLKRSPNMMLKRNHGIQGDIIFHESKDEGAGWEVAPQLESKPNNI